MARSALSDWEAQIIQEAMDEARTLDPIFRRFDRKYFVSRSKGRGRRRSHWKEIILIHDRYNPISRFTSAHRFKFDVVASEVFPSLTGLDAEAKLMARLEA